METTHWYCGFVTALITVQLGMDGKTNLAVIAMIVGLCANKGMHWFTNKKKGGASNE
jgi:hypothetical protein